MNYQVKKMEIADFINTMREKALKGELIDATTGKPVDYSGITGNEIMASYVLGKNHVYQSLLETDMVEETGKALAALNEAVAMYNDFARCNRISALLELGPKAGMEEYLEDQTVVGYAIKPKKDSAVMELEAGKAIQLKPVDFLRVACEKEMPRLRDLVRIFSHKMVAYMTHNDTGISYAGMSASYIQLAKALAEKNPVWDTPAAELSKSKMAWMLEDIVKIMTFGTVQKMQSSDVTYLMLEVFTTRNVANEAGQIVIKSADAILNGVFRAAYTRKKGMAYPFQSKDKVDTKAAESLVSNPVMAEPKTRPQATPKAGEVTSTVESAPAEKPKKSGKKSAAKKSTTKKSENVEVPAVSAGDNVTHSVLGDGVVSEVTKSTISVDFNGDIKPFQFPGAFADGFLVKK